MESVPPKPDGEDVEPVPSGMYAFPPLDKVSFGPGSVQRLSDEVDRLGGKRVLLATTSSLTRTPLVSRVQHLLGKRCVGTTSAARQHNPADTVLETVHAAEESRADVLVSLGGGSVIDNVKAAVLALARDTGTFPPHIALPTTLSAAEFSASFGVTDEQTRQKTSASSPFVQPQLVILDVELTAYTPDWLWFASGVRALDHAVETVYAPNHQPATDATALEAIRLLFTHLEASGGARRSLAARQQSQIAAWLSFFGVSNVTLGLSHALGREIGPRYDVPHGYTSAVLLPRVMAYLLAETVERQALIAGAAGVASAGRASSEVALEAAPAVAELIGRLGLPRRLRDLGVPHDDLTTLAAGREDVLHILREAW